ncbi:hypothetical protein [Paucibacter soli]|uniref:hypothetical protein n=1 Tax=Paucibacter soli TaxID=3133433 RepID=UPI003097E8B3
MRAALSILGLVIAFAVVMFVMKKQVQQLNKPAPSAVAASAPGGLPAPQAVGQQVQGALELGAQRASDANP